jgi:hypothetical protein
MKDVNLTHHRNIMLHCTTKVFAYPYLENDASSKDVFILINLLLSSLSFNELPLKSLALPN